MMDELRIRQAASGDGSLLTEAELEIDGGLTDAKILLADASDTLAGKVRSYLAEDGHQTAHVKTVREAMVRAQAETFELMIVRLNPGKEDGLRMSSHFASQHDTSPVPHPHLGPSPSR